MHDSRVESDAFGVGVKVLGPVRGDAERAGGVADAQFARSSSPAYKSDTASFAPSEHGDFSGSTASPVKPWPTVG